VAHPRRASRRDTSGANGYTIGNPSRQYLSFRYLGTILKLILRVPDPDLQTGTESRHHSQLNLGKTLNNDQRPPYEQENHTEQPGTRVNGGFLRGMRELLNGAKSRSGFVGEARGGQEQEVDDNSQNTLGESTLGGYSTHRKPSRLTADNSTVEPNPSKEKNHGLWCRLRSACLDLYHVISY
jgi:hypothetical protein